jgi:hypothetical protein
VTHPNIPLGKKIRQKSPWHKKHLVSDTGGVFRFSGYGPPPINS